MLTEGERARLRRRAGEHRGVADGQDLKDHEAEREHRGQGAEQLDAGLSPVAPETRQRSARPSEEVAANVTGPGQR